MKILIISTSDLIGGAAIAAFRLMQGLNENGVKAKMLVLDKLSKNDNITHVGRKLSNKLNFYYERWQIFTKNKFSRNNLFDISIATTGVSVTNRLDFKEADVIHLHWINQGMLSLNEIGEILASGKKIVWTMHDMWAFTGICHHAGTCTNYQTDCGMCPYLLSPSQNDLSYKIFKKKQSVFANGQITFVACSNWLRDLAELSPLTENHLLTSIPNPIDTTKYCPQDKSIIRQQLNLPDDKKIILFAAAKVSDKRKGIDYLIEAANILLSNNKDNIIFLMAGGNGDVIASQLPLSAINMGYVDSAQMMNLYNASDLFVTPSLQENLPNTIMEAMACGTPCVGFDIGGIPEMIQHKHTGYIAKYKDAKDLSDGISWVLYDSDINLLSEKSREFAVKNYSQEQIVKQYIDLYK